MTKPLIFFIRFENLFFSPLLSVLPILLSSGVLIFPLPSESLRYADWERERVGPVAERPLVENLAKASQVLSKTWKIRWVRGDRVI